MVCIIFCLNFCRLFFLDHNIIIFGIFCVMNDEMDGRVEMTKTVRHRCILRLLMFRYHVEYNTSPKMSKSRNNFINTSTNVSCDVMVMMLRRRLFFFNKKNTPLYLPRHHCALFQWLHTLLHIIYIIYC